MWETNKLIYGATKRAWHESGPKEIDQGDCGNVKSCFRSKWMHVPATGRVVSSNLVPYREVYNHSSCTVIRCSGLFGACKVGLMGSYRGFG